MARRSCGVVGLGLFGRRIALTLSQLGMDVLAVDRDETLIEAIKDEVAAAVCTDVTDEHAMLASGLPGVDVCVVAIGENMESSILVTALLKKHGVQNIIARAHSDIHAQVLRTVGALRTVDPEDEMGVRVAEEVFAPDVHARIRLSTGQEVVEIQAHRNLVGKTVQELDFRRKYRLNIIAIKRRRPGADLADNGPSAFDVIRLPRPEDVLEPGDVLVLIGDAEMVRAFLEV